LFGQLQANGFKVFPANDLPIGGRSEDAGFNGGYTVQTYGSHTAAGVDAILMEFGSKYRQKSALDQTARDAARSIVAFYKVHLQRRGQMASHGARTDEKRPAAR
jgi:hypothetical protein